MGFTYRKKSWSSTQSVVALSSGEAEYYGMVKGASVALGLQSVLKDFNIECSITLKSDASAAIATSNRRGLGKVRRIEVGQLWLQDKVRQGDINVVKVDTHENVADAYEEYQSTSYRRTARTSTCYGVPVKRLPFPYIGCDSSSRAVETMVLILTFSPLKMLGAQDNPVNLRTLPSSTASAFQVLPTTEERY